VSEMQQRHCPQDGICVSVLQYRTAVLCWLRRTASHKTAGLLQVTCCVCHTYGTQQPEAALVPYSSNMCAAGEDMLG
jgi:hypothetical protein